MEPVYYLVAAKGRARFVSESMKNAMSSHKPYPLTWAQSGTGPTRSAQNSGHARSEHLLDRTVIFELAFRACVPRPSSFPSVARSGRYAAKVIGTARRFGKGPLQGRRKKHRFGNARSEDFCCCTGETLCGASPKSDRQIGLLYYIVQIIILLPNHQNYELLLVRSFLLV